VVVGQKDTGVRDSLQAVVVVPVVHQRGDLGRHPHLCGLCRGRGSPWAAIVAACWRSPYCCVVVGLIRQERRVSRGVVRRPEKSNSKIKAVGKQDSAMGLDVVTGGYCFVGE